MRTATEWAREQGVHYRGTIALDNYEPTRDFTTVDAYAYEDSTNSDQCYVIDGTSDLRHARKATYLMDDGTTVQPFYVAAWHPDHDYVIVHPFPVNVHVDGTPQLRANDGRPVNFDSWALGPRVAYHVKLRKVEA